MRRGAVLDGLRSQREAIPDLARVFGAYRIEPIPNQAPNTRLRQYPSTEVVDLWINADEGLREAQSLPGVNARALPRALAQTPFFFRNTRQAELTV
ncbi:hypothetical protein EWI61_11165 [Methylolobus aquaticus]|nr:hypothetical protein EWI61_11165 [Methylolobus aquaticus]